MENKILMATHGKMAEGVLNSLEMIAGHKDNVAFITMYTDESVDYPMKVQEAVSSHDYETSNLIVITDIAGGSVNAEFLKHLPFYNFNLIAGLSLPLVLEIMFLPSDDVDRRLSELASNGGLYVTYCNDVLLESSDSGDLFD